MNNVNKIILVGNLGHDPVLRHTEKGDPYLKISLATSRDIRNAEGEKEREEVSWHKATMWGKRAEACAKFLTRGSRVYLEGELRMQTYQDKEGIKRKGADIHVEKIVNLGQPGGSGMRSPADALTPLSSAQ